MLTFVDRLMACHVASLYSHITLPRSNMREFTSASFRGKDHCECEREGGGSGEHLQGDHWICSKKYRVLTCYDKNCLVS